jgi:hypothetical protein
MKGPAFSTPRHVPVDGGMMDDVMSPHLVIDRSAIRSFCQRHRIARLALFGSALSDDFGPDSDVDVLVEFQPGHVPGLDFVSCPIVDRRGQFSPGELFNLIYALIEPRPLVAVARS